MKPTLVATNDAMAAPWNARVRSNVRLEGEREEQHRVGPRARSECSGHGPRSVGYGGRAGDGRGAEHREVEMPLANACGALDPDGLGPLGLRAGERVDPAGERARGELGEAGGEEQ